MIFANMPNLYIHVAQLAFPVTVPCWELPEGRTLASTAQQALGPGMGCESLFPLDLQEVGQREERGDTLHFL